MTDPPCLAENNLKSIFFRFFSSRSEYKSNIGTCDINTSFENLVSEVQNYLFLFLYTTMVNSAFFTRTNTITLNWSVL